MRPRSRWNNAGLGAGKPPADSNLTSKAVGQASLPAAPPSMKALVLPQAAAAAVLAPGPRLAVNYFREWSPSIGKAAEGFSGSTV